MPEVDAEQGCAGAVGQLGRPQDGAVATDDQRELAVVADRRARGRLPRRCRAPGGRAPWPRPPAGVRRAPAAPARPRPHPRPHAPPRARCGRAAGCGVRRPGRCRSRGQPFDPAPPVRRVGPPRSRSRPGPPAPRRHAARGRTPRSPTDPAAGSSSRHARPAATGGGPRDRLDSFGPVPRSRTTPPLPRRSLPTSKCGLTISDEVTVGPGRPRSARPAPASAR